MLLYNYIAAIGICYIIKYGTILINIKNYTATIFPILKDLYSCCLCLGFWVGLSQLSIIDLNISQKILFPFTTSAVCYIGDMILMLLQNMIYYYDKKGDYYSLSSSLSSLDNSSNCSSDKLE